MRNSLTIFSFFVTINLLLSTCFSPASSFNNTDDRPAIQSDAQSRTARQYMMTVIDPYAAGLFSYYQPSNPFSLSIAVPPTIEETSEPDASVPANIPLKSEPDSSVPANIQGTSEPDASVHVNIPLKSEPGSSVPANIPSTNESDASVPANIPITSEPDSPVPADIPLTSEPDSSVSFNIHDAITTAKSFDEELEKEFDYDDEAIISLKQQYPCGRGPADLPTRQVVDDIVGGTEAAKNSWPFVAAIRYDGVVRCGGFLVSANRIITAANCVDKETSFGISKMSVSLGMHTIGSRALQTRDDSQVTRRVSRVIMHNGFNAASLANDIAILVLESPVVYSEAISPVCLPAASADPDEYSNQNVAIVGWGALTSGGKQADALQQVTSAIITHTLCNGYYSRLTRNMLCTYTPDKAACQGDSGGPVVVRSESGVWTVVGLNSYTRSCGGATDYPSVKTRISAYINWINKNIK